MFKKQLLIFLFVTGIIVLVTLVYHYKNSFRESNYLNPKTFPVHYNGDKFAGSESCMQCHSDIYEDHINTAHHKTSEWPDDTSIKGSFKPPSNLLRLNNIDYYMVRKGGDFYQIGKSKDKNQEISSSKIDIVIGSGTKGQSYLSWDSDKLYQIQTSYFTISNSWVNSPGYPNEQFVRATSDECLKCHLTFAQNTDFEGRGNQYLKETLFLGVECERCHGPSEKHVDYHLQNPDNQKIAEYMPSIKNFSRQQRLDACAQCHGGLRNNKIKGNPFEFVIGDTLENYSRNYYNTVSNYDLDVHGNQFGLLQNSKCFKNSEDLDCTTCHNPHKNERGKISLFNKICMDCHISENQPISLCKGEINEVEKLQNNCVSCHMPLIPSKSMKVRLDQNSDEKPILVRSHLIKVYPKS